MLDTTGDNAAKGPGTPGFEQLGRDDPRPAAVAQAEPGSSDLRPGAAEQIAETILREHPDAHVCALAPDGLISHLPKSIGLWGQTLIDGRALIDHVHASDRWSVIKTWEATLAGGHAEARVRLLERPGEWMTLHFLDLRAAHGVLLGAVVPTGEAAEGDEGSEDRQAPTIRYATMREDEHGTIIDCDDAFLELSGYNVEEVIGTPGIANVHPDEHGRIVESWLALLATGNSQQTRARSRRKDGTWAWIDSTMHNFLNQPDRGYVLIELIDVSAEMAAHEEVREREALLRRLIETMPDGIFQVDMERSIHFYNDRLVEIFKGPGAVAASAQPSRDGEQPSPEAAARRPKLTLEDLCRSLAAEDRGRFEQALSETLENGSDADIELDLYPTADQWRRVQMCLRGLSLEDGQTSGALVSTLDITEQAIAHRELEHRATFDALTHCYNRASILAELDAELAGPKRDEVGVIYVDLDHFKQVNDSQGHAAGDEVLVDVAERLRQAVRSEDKVGRLGGDEFLLIIHGLPEPDVAMGVAQRICDSLRSPIAVSTGPVQLCASLGVACAAGHSLSAEELIKRADAAMYRSKERREGLPVLTGACDD